MEDKDAGKFFELMTGLAENLGAVTSTAFTAGMSFEQLLATISTVTRNGVAMDQAITGINSVLTAFINPQDAAIKAGKEFGLVVSSNTLRTLGFAEVIKKLAKATAEQQAAIVPNIRGFKAFAAAINDTAGLTADLTLISEDFSGRTETAFVKMSDTVGFESRRIKQQVVGLGRVFGIPILDPFQNALIELNKKMDGFNAWIKEAAPKIKAFGEAMFGAFPEELGKRIDKFKFDVDMFGDAEAVRILVKGLVEEALSAMESAFIAAKPVFKKMGELIGAGIVSGIKSAFSVSLSYKEGGFTLTESSRELKRLRENAKEKGIRFETGTGRVMTGGQVPFSAGRSRKVGATSGN